MYVGADGCSEGWIAITYTDSGYSRAEFYKDIEDLWTDNSAAERILVDVPIGLRDEIGDPRPADDAAREKLKPDRYRSVFTPPIREATKADSYEEAKRIQEEKTERSLSRQSWGIANKIAAVDALLQKDEEARDCIRESHPEVCFAEFAGAPMTYSKASGGTRAFWERVNVLREVDSGIIEHLELASQIDGAEAVDNDDLLDAFVLALTAYGDEVSLRTLPETVGTDAEDLPMEIVYRSDPDPVTADGA